MKMNKKGFTLIEMLVVIAIIAVLVSIIIPTVMSSTEKANHAADAANLRSLKAEITTEMLTMAAPSGNDSATSPSGRWTFTAASGKWIKAEVAIDEGAAVFELPFDSEDAFACTITDGDIEVTLNGYTIAELAAAAEGETLPIEAK